MSLDDFFEKANKAHGVALKEPSEGGGSSVTQSLLYEEMHRRHME